MPSLTSLIFVAVAIGGILTALGLRTGRTPGQRRCARCRYDLCGMPISALHCPECGANLAPHGAVLMDARAHRSRLLGSGLPFLALVAVALGVRGVQWLDRVDWPALKPAAWLTYPATSSNEETATSAFSELARRLDRGALSTDQLRALAERGLERQNDEGAHWEPRWGTFIDRAIQAGLLSDAQREAYLRHCVNCSMALQHTRTTERQLNPMGTEEVRKARLVASEALHVTKFDCVDIEFAVAAQRAGEGSRLIIDARPLSASIGAWQCPDLPADRANRLLFYHRMIQKGWIRSTRVLWLPAVVEPGEYSVKMSWEVNVRLEDDPPERGVVMTMEFAQPLVVEPPDEHAVPIVTDAASTEALKEAFHVRALGFRTHTLRRWTQPVTIIYVHTDSGPAQRLKHEDPLAPFNGSIKVDVQNDGRSLQRIGSSLPGGWIPVVVDDDSIAAIDLTVHYSTTGRTVIVGEGPGFGGTHPQPIWMGPPFEVKDTPVTWFDTVDEANLTPDEREAISFSEPAPPRN